MRNIDEVSDIKVNGRIVNNFRNADDTVLIVNSQENLQKLLNKIVSERERLELTPNKKNTQNPWLLTEYYSKTEHKIKGTAPTKVDKFK